MSAQTYNRIILICTIVAILAVVAMNISLDIHRVFGLCHWNKIFLDENLRFLKTEHLKRDRDYDAFIFGSSRANFYSAQSASEFTGLRFYNFNSPAEKIDRILKKIEWLKRSGIPMKQVIIALDFDFMFIADDLLETAIVTQEHPDVSGESYLDFYVPFIFQFDWKGWKRFVKIKMGRKSHENIRLDLNTGNWYYPQKDELIAKSPEKYLKEKFPTKLPYERGTNRMAVNIERLKKLIGYLDHERIPRVVLINPYYKDNYQSFDSGEYRQWLKDVVSVCGKVWDFSGPNKVTQDPYLYYDMSHFRYPVGDMVLKRILDDTGEHDFGILRTQNDLQAP